MGVASGYRYLAGIVLGACGIVNAQFLSVGIKGGVPVTDAVEGSLGVHSEARRYTVGPMAQVSLPFSLAVEVDALYRRTGYSTSITEFGSTTSTHIRANSWEFPILLKYYLPGYGMPVRPYAEGGYVVRHISGVQASALTGNQEFPLNSRFLLEDDPSHGAVIGGGVEIGIGRLRAAPEFRYTHWSNRPFNDIGSHGFFARSVSNQAEFLFGLRF